jgi:GT2 family glycosyltransferase
VAAACAIGGYQHWMPRAAERMMLVGSWHHDRPRQVDWAVGAALLLPRAIADQVGGWDERFFMYAEDLEWCWRATRMGFPIRFEPAAVVRHVGGASSSKTYGSTTPLAYMRNSYRTYRRFHGPLSTLGYRVLNLVGCGRQLVAARVRRDAGRTAYWRMQLKANLVSTGGTDGPLR